MKWQFKVRSVIIVLFFVDILYFKVLIVYVVILLKESNRSTFTLNMFTNLESKPSYVEPNIL